MSTPVQQQRGASLPSAPGGRGRGAFLPCREGLPQRRADSRGTGDTQGPSTGGRGPVTPGFILPSSVSSLSSLQLDPSGEQRAESLWTCVHRSASGPQGRAVASRAVGHAHPRLQGHPGFISAPALEMHLNLLTYTSSRRQDGALVGAGAQADLAKLPRPSTGPDSSRMFPVWEQARLC